MIKYVETHFANADLALDNEVEDVMIKVRAEESFYTLQGKPTGGL